MSNTMFKFRSQTAGGEWVVGCFVRVHEDYPQIVTTEKALPEDVIANYERDYETHFVYDIIPETLSISTGKLDSTGTEIFASFPIDGVMTEGGDVVSWFGGKGKPIVFEDSCFWFGDKESDDIPMFSLPSPEITIIDKGGGNDE